MANDYLTLANGSRPQMQPDYTYGIGMWAGMDYGRQQRRHEGDMNNARGMAALAAEMDAQKQREFMMGQPGREANISTENALALGRQRQAPNLVETQDTDIRTKSRESKRKEMESIMKELDPWAQQWAAAQTPEQKQEIIIDMRNNGMTHIGNRPIDQVDPRKLDDLMKRHHSARTYQDPEHLRKVAVEEQKEKARLALEDKKIKARMEIAEKGNALREKLARQKLDVNSPDMINFVGKKLWDEAKTPEERSAVVEWVQNAKMAVAAAKAQSGPQQLDLKPDLSGVETRNPTVPQAAPLPGQRRQSNADINAGGLPRVTDQASYDAVPRGAEYLDGKGIKRRKL